MYAEVTKSVLMAAILGSDSHSGSSLFMRTMFCVLSSNSELTKQEGGGKKMVNPHSAKSLTIILFEKTFRHTSPSFKQIFL